MHRKNPIRIVKDRKWGTKYAELCDKIKRDKLAPSEVAAFLKKQGYTAGSAASIASRLMNLSKPENAGALEDVRSGKMTVRNAIAQLTQKQINPAKSDEEKLYELIKKTAKLAIQLKCDRQTFVDQCIVAFEAENLTTT
jgi:hypothetical protein